MYRDLKAPLAGEFVTDADGVKTYRGGWKDIDEFKSFWTLCKQTLGSSGKTVRMGDEVVPELLFQEYKVETFFKLAYKKT